MTTISNRTFGVELEVMMTGNLFSDSGRRALANALVAAGISARVESYGHSVPTSWKVITDGSLGYERGAEIVSPVLSGEEGLRQVKVVCEVLTQMGCKATRECGMHVHFGANDLSVQGVKNVVKYYAKYEAAIDLLMPAARRASNNTFCASNVRGSLADTYAAIDRCASVRDIAYNVYNGGSYNGRYWKMNLLAFVRQGTIEFRQHSGTTNATKAVNWIKLLDGMISRSIARRTITKGTPMTAEKRLAKLLSMAGREVSSFYRKRADSFTATGRARPDSVAEAA